MKDNLFPEYNNNEICRVPLFSERIGFLGDGDILEFGAGSGFSSICMARYNLTRTVFTFDHFQGLEQTSKPYPAESGWVQGAFRLGHPTLPHWPQSIDAFKEKIKNDPNNGSASCMIVQRQKKTPDKLPYQG